MIDFEKVFSDLDIKRDDNLLVNSDIKKILIHFKRAKEKFDPNLILDELLNKISKNGTLLLPTFNWDFCSGKEFDYFKTPSRSGSLTKIALTRRDFVRTKKPHLFFCS